MTTLDLDLVVARAVHISMSIGTRGTDFYDHCFLSLCCEVPLRLLQHYFEHTLMSGSPLNDIISVMIDHMNISKMEVAT